MGNETAKVGNEMGTKIDRLTMVAEKLIKSIGWEIGKHVSPLEVLPDYQSYVDENDNDVIVPALKIDEFYIYPNTYTDTIKTIAGERKVSREGYTIEVGTVEHNYPNEPDFEDYAEVGNFPTEATAIAEVLTHLFENRLDNAMEAMWEEYNEHLLSTSEPYGSWD